MKRSIKQFLFRKFAPVKVTTGTLQFQCFRVTLHTQSLPTITVISEEEFADTIDEEKFIEESLSIPPSVIEMM